ncbi:unnamed protein product [Citrullus colocynthis]|uniref:Two-component response regulator n=1 Tax=Citrullus colocynthis TaxID=252529 RepID=A0ABP0ZDJ9_9ROSI
MEDFDNPTPNPIPLKAEEDDQFPIGLKVLAIDANIVCLHYLVRLLQKCQYKVVSANEELEMVKRGVMEGAEDYLLKPVRLQELKNIWQHVLRKRSARKRSNPNLLLLEQAVVQEEDHNSIERVTITMDKQDYDESNEIVKLDDINIVALSSSKKKQRVSWTKELHEKFVEAYEQLREKERVPNNILKLMNDPSLTRENVASHLQKHRDTLRKKKASGVGKLAKQKNLYDRNPTKASTLYNSMNHMNKVSNLGPQFRINGEFQFPNRARSSMEGLQGIQNPQSTWTAAGSCFPLPEFKWFNFPSNNSISNPCDDNEQHFGGFDPININSTYYPPLETNCNTLNANNSPSLVGNYAIENHNYVDAGQCYRMQFNAGNSLGSLLMDDDLADIFK